MGALTDALAAAAAARGRRAADGRRGGRDRGGRATTPRSSAEDDGCEIRSNARRVLFGAAPCELARLTGRAGARRRPEGSQLKVNLLLSAPAAPARAGIAPERAFAGTFHVNETASQLQRAYERAAAGELPDPVPCEAYCHSLTDPSILVAGAARGRRPHAHACSRLHMPARLFAADPDGAARARARRDARLARQRPRRAARGLPAARRRRPPVHRGTQPARSRATSCACRAGTSSTAICRGRSPRTRRDVGTLGRRDRASAGAAVRRRRAPRRRRQRHPGAQRGDGGARTWRLAVLRAPSACR